MKARLSNLSIGLDGEYILTITTRENVRELYDELRGVDVEVTIKKHRKKRSLDANAYAWVLMDKIAAATKTTKTEVYLHAIAEVGGNSEIVCAQDRAVDKLRESWGKNGVGWITDTMPSKIDGCTNVILYYGSSSFCSSQMSRLIENLVQDCVALGIETMPPDKLNALLGEWK